MFHVSCSWNIGSNQDVLMKQSMFLRPEILGRIRNGHHIEWQEELQDITRQEAAEKQWLDGPFIFPTGQRHD